MSSLFDKASKARQASNFKKAQILYEAILRRPSLTPDDKAEALSGLADVERLQGSFGDALGHYIQATRLYQILEPSASWDALVGWALTARAIGRPKESLKVLDMALSFYNKEKDFEGMAFTHWALGGTLRIAGRMKEGLKELKTALRMFQKLKNAEGTAYTSCALGGLYRMMGRYAESGRFYREANQRMRSQKDTFGIAYSYCGLGNVERMAGRYDKALPFYQKAEKLYGTIGDRVSYAYTLWSIGTTYKMVLSFSRALQSFRKADQLFKATGDTRGRIYALLGFAESEWLKGHAAKGKVFWNKAKAITDKSDFAWEKLHVKALKNGRINPLKSSYQKAGSKFYPRSLPVNWP